MFTTTITLTNPDTSVTDLEKFNTIYSELIGAEAEAELNYIRSDHIIDSKMREESWKEWNNEDKRATFIYYHDTNEGRRDYNLAITEGVVAVEAQRKLHQVGWTIEVTLGTSENASKSNKLHMIDQWAISTVRPDRREEVLALIAS
jgi:hypothetical protein